MCKVFGNARLPVSEGSEVSEMDGHLSPTFSELPGRFGHVYPSTPEIPELFREKRQFRGERCGSVPGRGGFE